MMNDAKLEQLYREGVRPSVAAQVLRMRRSDVVRSYGLFANGTREVTVTRKDRAMIRRDGGVQRDLDGATDQEGVSLDWPAEWYETHVCLESSSPSFDSLHQTALNRMRRNIPGGSWAHEAKRVGKKG